MSTSVILQNRSSTTASPPALQFAQLAITSVGGVTKLWTGDAAGVVTQLSSTDIFNSPNFTGTPTAPTQPTADDSTKLATTAYVHDLFDTAVNYTASTGVKKVGNDFQAQTYSGSTTTLIPVKVDPLGLAVGVDNISIRSNTDGNLYVASGPAIIDGGVF